MGETSKPFACTIDGCEMTFTNEDHLNWHGKKHDMVLNLGIANKNAEVADQTPTPTRFIRNCEEVGLFQDLQNVNPFDETFKKAVESVKAGTLHVPELASNDDTLHTPHIFPHVQEPRDKYTREQSTQSGDFCITTVPTIEVCEHSETYTSIENALTANEKEKIKSAHLKNKLKEAIINKGKITPVPLEKLKIDNIKPQNASIGANSTQVAKSPQSSKTQDPKEKLREMNRAAQLRCRKRKRVKLEKMEDDLKALKEENSKLNSENITLRNKISDLRELVLKERTEDSNALVSKIEVILEACNLPARKLSSNSAPILRQKPIKKPLPISSSPIVPFAVQQSTKSEQKTLLIQVLGSVSHMAVSVLPKSDRHADNKM